MFEISYDKIRNPGFKGSFRKVMGATGWPSTKVAYNVARLGKLLQKEANIANELFEKEILRKYVKSDEQGKLLQDKGQWDLKDEITLDHFESEARKFHEHTVKIERYQLTLAELDAVKELTPQDLLNLGPVIEGQDESN